MSIGKRVIAAIVGFISISNGLAMISDSHGWYMSTPGVVDSGPYNAHFVVDIGAAFLCSGLALLARSWRENLWPAALAGSGFLVGHTVIHLAEYAHHPRDLAVLLMIAIPSLLGLLASLPTIMIFSKGGKEYV